MERMRARHRPPAWLTAVAAFAIAAACSSEPSTSTATPPSSGGASVAVAEILDFTAPRLGGGTVDGADYAGKDTAIWFWAPW